ncbi:unnamed protein product [Urochloa humidicola]
MVLQEKVGVHLPQDAPGPEWASIECSSKEAYGCGKVGERLLKGLTLYVRRSASSSVLNSKLSIHLGDVALRSIQEELGVPGEFQGVEGCLPEMDGAIKIADRGVLVVMVIFRRRNHTKRVYYLVYDAKDSSLYMIPYIPEDLEATFTLTPVPARPAGVQGHVIVLMARKFWPQRAERGRLCVFTPSTSAKPARDSADSPWMMKVHSFPKLPQTFSADVMFSFKDKGFWADLSQGVVYSDLRQGSPAVFIELPYGYQIDLSALPTYVVYEPANKNRTMGCVGGSIKFICITRHDVTTRVGYHMVRVWTLDLDHQQWKEDRGFPCMWKDFWKRCCQMDSKLNHLLTLDPQFPILTSDGALSLLLPNSNNILGRRRKEADYICSFDMASKRCLWFGHVFRYDSIEPVILPSGFFKNCCPVPLERKLPTPKRKLLSVVQVPMHRPMFSKEGILLEGAS